MYELDKGDNELPNQKTKWSNLLESIIKGLWMDTMFCGENYRRKREWKKRVLYDANWKAAEIVKEDGEKWRLEVEYVKDDETYYGESIFDFSSRGWRIFRVWSSWWMVADNWTIIWPKYKEMVSCQRDFGGHVVDYVRARMVFDDWTEKEYEILVSDWTTTEK